MNFCVNHFSATMCLYLGFIYSVQQTAQSFMLINTFCLRHIDWIGCFQYNSNNMQFPLNDFKWNNVCSFFFFGLFLLFDLESDFHMFIFRISNLVNKFLLTIQKVRTYLVTCISSEWGAMNYTVSLVICFQERSFVPVTFNSYTQSIEMNTFYVATRSNTLTPC